jgi:hypothetical protein
MARSAALLVGSTPTCRWQRVRGMLLKTSAGASVPAAFALRIPNASRNAASRGDGRSNQRSHAIKPSDVCLVPTQVSRLGRPLGTSGRVLQCVSRDCHESYLGSWVNSGINSIFSWKEAGEEAETMLLMKRITVSQCITPLPQGQLAPESTRKSSPLRGTSQ